MNIRFLHTGDWQLGMTRHFFSEGVQERFTQSRFDAIGNLGRLAGEADCLFMVVCGDIFESNLVDRKTVARALEALKGIPVPVYLLPGNHDPLNAASVYRSATFLNRKPDHVHVIENGIPLPVFEGIEIVGAPWTSKKPSQDLFSLSLRTLEPVEDGIRIGVAHGIVDALSPNREDPALISLSAAEEALARHQIHYLALGDRHSLTRIGESGRIWYAGTPEATDFNEVKSGHALMTTLTDEGVSTEAVAIGSWTFIERPQVDMNSREDIEALRVWFEGLENKAQTVVKLRFVGTLSLAHYTLLEELLAQSKELLGALETRFRDLAVLPEDSDFLELGFSGFAGSTVDRLRDMVKRAGPEAISARDALALMVRLSKGGGI